MARLISPWAGHWREAEFYGFVKWALGEEPLRHQYREQTGDQFEPSADLRRMGQQIGSGEAHAYVERFANWLAHNVFGTPDDIEDDPVEAAVARTIH